MSMISNLMYDVQMQNSNNTVFAGACANKHCLQFKSLYVRETAIKLHN